MSPATPPVTLVETQRLIHCTVPGNEEANYLKRVALHMDSTHLVYFTSAGSEGRWNLARLNRHGTFTFSNNSNPR